MFPLVVGEADIFDEALRMLGKELELDRLIAFLTDGEICKALVVLLSSVTAVWLQLMVVQICTKKEILLNIFGDSPKTMLSINSNN